LTKYEPKHKIVEDLHLKGSIAEMTDSAIDHLGRILDNTGPRDIVYVGAYLSGVYLSYITISHVEMSIGDFVYKLLNVGDILAGTMPPSPIKQEGLDARILAESMVASYILLKIDAADITSAVSKVAIAIGAIAV